MLSPVMLTTRLCHPVNTKAWGMPIFDVAAAEGKVVEDKVVAEGRGAPVGLCLQAWLQWGERSLSWRAGSPTRLTSSDPKPKGMR